MVSSVGLGKMAVVGGDPAKWPMEKCFNFLTLFFHPSINEPQQINMVVKLKKLEDKVSLTFNDKLKKNPNTEEAHDQPYLPVEVDFYRDKIIYQYEGCVTVIEEEELVHYFYMLMKKMSLPWM